MRTLKFRKVLEQCAAACGIAPSSDDYTTEFIELLTAWINLRLEDAWYRHRWPEIMAVEERQFAATYSAATAYVEDDIVYYDSKYWLALQASTGQTPADGSAYWEATSDYDLQIEFEQDWATTVIGRFVSITDRNPRKSRAGLQYLFQVDDEGAWLTSSCTNPTVWVQFWPRCPEFSSALWDADTTYAEGDLAYSEDSGECYKAKGASTNQDPVTDSTEIYWEVVHFPKFLLAWMQRAVKSEYLRDDNQDDKADGQESLAELQMARTYDAEFGGQSQDEAPMRASGYGVNNGAF